MNQSKENPAELQFQEVYVSDILPLKHFFNELNGVAKDAPVNAAFGIPLIQVKCGNEIIAFASLTVSDMNENKLSVFQKSSFNLAKEKEWKSMAEQTFRQQSDLLCKEQFENSVIRLTSWLNNACN